MSDEAVYIDLIATLFIPKLILSVLVFAIVVGIFWYIIKKYIIYN